MRIFLLQGELDLEMELIDGTISLNYGWIDEILAKLLYTCFLSTLAKKS